MFTLKTLIKQQAKEEREEEKKIKKAEEQEEQLKIAEDPEPGSMPDTEMVERFVIGLILFNSPQISINKLR